MVRFIVALLLSTTAFASGTSPLYPPGQADNPNSAPVVLSSEQLTGTISTAENQQEIIDRLDSILAEEATEAKQDIGNGFLQSIDGTLDVQLSTRLSEVAFLIFAAQNNTDLVGVQARLDTANTRLGDLTETAPVTDTASSGLNGRLQRVSQRLTSLIGVVALDSTLQGTNSRLDTANGHLSSLDSDFDVPLSTRASEATLSSFLSANHTDLLGVQSRIDTANGHLVTIQGKQDAQTTLQTTIRDNADDVEPRLGATNETAAASDTATSGLNGLIKRLLQRMTTLIAFYSSNFGANSGGIRVNAQVGNSTGAAAFGSGATNAQTQRVASNLYDGAGNAVTSQVSGALRPVDVGVIVGGATIDPRHGITRVTQPTAAGDGTGQLKALGPYGLTLIANQAYTLTLWGKMFSVSSDYISIGGAVAPYFMLRNPAGSGKVCQIHSMHLASPQSGNVVYRVYWNPTILTNGTTLTAAGGRSSGQASNVCIPSRSPTVSANGTLMFSDNVPNQSSGVVVPPAGSRILDPGDEIMVTVDQSLAGQAGAVNIEWSEQP